MKVSQAVIDAWFERAFWYQGLAARARTDEGREFAVRMNEFYSDRIEASGWPNN